MAIPSDHGFWHPYMIAGHSNFLARLELRQLSRSSVEYGLVSSLSLLELWPWVNDLRLQKCRKDWYLRLKHSTHQPVERLERHRPVVPVLLCISDTLHTCPLPPLCLSTPVICQYRLTLALALHLSLPRCPSWITWSMSGRRT